jgi:hypothetical protein
MFRHFRVIFREPAISTLPSYTSVSNSSVIILYSNQPIHNYFTNYHTATCFDTFVSSSGSLQSVPCQVTQVFQMHLLLFCTVTNQYIIISQIITLLHVSTLSCLPQGACNQHVAKLHKYFKFQVLQ